MIPGALHISSGIYSTAKENPEKPEIGGHLLKAVRLVTISVGVPFLQMRSVGSHSTSGREKEGIKERMGLNNRTQ